MSNKLVDEEPPATLAKYDDIYLPIEFGRFQDTIRNMDVRDDDVWLCSYPRSGTTWTKEMLWLIANNLDFDGARKCLSQCFPTLESYSYKARKRACEPPEYISNSAIYVVNAKSPRFIMTHLPLKFLPHKLQNNSTKAKIVYVKRNPRDVCLSLFHFRKDFLGYTGDFENSTEEFLNNKLCFGPYWNHVLDHWERRNNKNELILTYEDMKRDLRTAIRQTADFLGKKLSDEGIEQLLEHLQIENMRENCLDKSTESQKFFRCGQVSQWKQMTPLMLDKFDRWEKENISGTDFSY